MSRRPGRPHPRRWVLLGWTALLWVPLLAAGLTLLVVQGTAWQAGQRYEDRAYDEAAEGFASLAWVPFERWKAPFGTGTAELAALRSPRAALVDLDRALELAPDDARCTVQTNRAEAIAAIADDLYADAQQRARWAVELRDIAWGRVEPDSSPPWGTRTLATVLAEGTELAEESAARYAEAAATAEDPSCDDGSDESDTQDDEQQDRADELREEQQQAQDEADRLRGQLADDTGTDPEQLAQEEADRQAAEEEARQQELQQRNGQSDEPSDDGAEGSGAGGTGTPW